MSGRHGSREVHRPARKPAARRGRRRQRIAPRAPARGRGAAGRPPPPAAPRRHRGRPGDFWSGGGGRCAPCGSRHNGSRLAARRASPGHAASRSTESSACNHCVVVPPAADRRHRCPPRRSGVRRDCPASDSPAGQQHPALGLHECQRRAAPPVRKRRRLRQPHQRGPSPGND
ncbi:MAG: hypothetical protein F4Y02_19170 [Chloroflexi bacterium]|nr:hypothetical protein [Chloroflexota bacterium]